MPAYARAQICRHPHRDRPAHTPDASSTLTKQVSADGFAHFKRQRCPLRFSLSLSLFSPCPSLSLFTPSLPMCLPSAFDSHFCSLSVSLSLFPSLCLSFALTIFCGLSDFHSCSLSISHFFPLSIFLLLSSTLSLTFSPPSPSPSLSFQQISALAPKRLTAHNLSHVTQEQSRAVAL